MPTRLALWVACAVAIGTAGLLVLAARSQQKGAVAAGTLHLASSHPARPPASWWGRATSTDGELMAPVVAPRPDASQPSAAALATTRPGETRTAGTVAVSRQAVRSQAVPTRPRSNHSTVVPVCASRAVTAICKWVSRHGGGSGTRNCASSFSTYARKFLWGTVLQPTSHQVDFWKAVMQQPRAPLRVNVGAGVLAVSAAAPDEMASWLHVDKQQLDITRPDEWVAAFARRVRGVDALVSEHVFEHLTLHDAEVALAAAFLFLRPGGRWRIAVPDGNFPSHAYQQHVAVGNEHGHRTLWTLSSLSAAIAAAGFSPEPWEWFDDRGAFHQQSPPGGWTPHTRRRDDERWGRIARSAAHDARNNVTEGRFVYTSLVVGAVKPSNCSVVRVDYRGRSNT